MSEPFYFCDVDGEDEPTIWLDRGLGADPTALVRLCDLPVRHRYSLWNALLVGLGIGVQQP